MLVVYRITNISNKRFYIGSTNNFIFRKAEHLKRLRDGLHHNKFLQADFNLFGEKYFCFDIVKDGFKNREAMLLCEYSLIHKTKKRNYNIHTDCPLDDHSPKSKGIRKNGKPFITGKLNKRQPDKIVKSRPIIHPELDAIAENKNKRNQTRMRFQKSI